MMKPYQERVIEEKQGLDSRIERLTAFIYTHVFESLDDAEQSRMRIQLSIMQAYATVLGERIAHFTDDAGETTGGGG